MLRWLFVYLIVSFSCVAGIAHAEQVSGAEPVQASMLVEEETIQPARPFWVAIRLELGEGWHSYWKNPGDAGMATAIDWQLPEGFTAGPIVWPTPKRFAISSVIGYGYDSEVLLLVQITPPSSPPLDKPIDIKANVRWLVCSDAYCMPGQGDISATLSVSGAFPRADKTTAEAFARARQTLPQQREGVQAYRLADRIELQLPMPKDGMPSDVYFCPETSDVVNHAVDAIITPSESSPNSFILALKSNEEKDPSVKIGNLKGVVVVNHGPKEALVNHAIDIDVPIMDTLSDRKFISMSDKPSSNKSLKNVAAKFPVEQKPEITETQKVQEVLDASIIPVSAPHEEFSGGLAMALLLAFVGGMILNLMPCVLPIVSFKIMSFVKMSGQSRALTIKHGLTFSAGVLVSFWVLAGALLVLQAYGRAVGWGFQLQEPLFVAVLAALLLVFGLSLFGLFEIGTSATNWAGSLAGKKKEGLTSSFLSGILATVVATPCTGPFLGSAVGYAVTLPAFQAMLIFTSLGLGMSLPYLLLAIYPGLLRFLPKPGPWMDTFREVMGFLMIATVLWLVWVFGAQTSSFAVTLLLAGFFSLTVGCWIYGKWGEPVCKRLTRMISSAIAAVFLVAGGYAIILSTSTSVAAIGEQEMDHARDTAWEPYSQERVEELQKKGVPVLVDFTAKWCLICQVNHLVLSTEAVDSKLDQLGVVRMKADWTKNDPKITEELRKHGRNSVPLYLLYGKDAQQTPKILPQVLTQDEVLEQLADM